MERGEGEVRSNERYFDVSTRMEPNGISTPSENIFFFHFFLLLGSTC